MGAIYGSSYYTIVNGPSWKDAQSTAKSIGGNLATINSAEENNWIVSQFNIKGMHDDQTKSNDHSAIAYWIGYTDESSEGIWTWASGEDSGYTNWHDDRHLGGQLSPNGGARENYAYLGGYTDKTWDDQPNVFGHRAFAIRGIGEIPLSYFSIANTSFREGKGGEVTITRTGGTTTSQTLRVKSRDGSATTADNDYSSISTTVSFAAGETSKTINVSTTADLDVEEDEYFKLTITPEGTDDVPAQITNGTATVTIKADDFKKGNSLYTIVAGASWTKAEQNAQSLGGHLVTISDSSENDFLANKYTQLLSVPDKNWGNKSRSGAWIGLNQNRSKDSRSWSSGIKNSYEKIPPSQDMNSLNYHGGYILIMSDPSGHANNNWWVEPVAGIQYYLSNGIKDENYWLYNHGIAEISLAPTPTYSLSTSTTSIDEKSKSSVRTTISTTGVDSGTRLYYKVSDSGITSSDFSIGDVKGMRRIKSDGTATFRHAAAADKTTEGSESFNIKLYTDKARTNLVATSDSISIRDTSKSQAKPTYSLSLTPFSISEGDAFRASVSTTGVTNGTTLYYTLKGGVSDDDFRANAGLTGNITIDSSGQASFTRKTLADKLTEGLETARVLLYSDQQRTIRVAGPEDIQIRDTSKTPAKSSYSIGFSSSTVKEGDILSSSISTSNVDRGTRIYWALTGSGVNGSDLSSGSLEGSSAIDNSGEFSLTHAIAEDKTTEGSESLKLQLFSDANRKSLLTQKSLTIRDTSTTPQSANLSSATVKGNLLTLSFDSELAKTTPNSARFSVRADGDAIGISSAKVNANAGTLELTLASSIKPNKSVRLSYSDLKGDQSSGVLQTPDGTDLDSFSTSVSNANKDNQPPKVTTAFIKDKTLTLSFSEDISSATPSNRRWTIKEDGNAIPVVFSNLDTTAAELDLQLANAVDAGSTITLSYRDLEGNQSSGVIEDLSGNDLASISNLSISNRTKRSTQPLNVNSAAIDGDTITIAFDRELATTRPNTGTFRVQANGKAIKVTNIKLEPANREALLTLKSTVAFGDSVSLSYTDAQGNQKRNVIEDLDGNDLATLSKLTVTNNTRKSTSDLKVDYADADGSTINLYLTDALSTSIPKASRFRVTANKRKQTIASVTTDRDAGIVTLNLNKPISSEKDILISYLDHNGDQRSGVIQDLDGNDLPSFSKLAPTNDSIDNDPPSLEDAYLDGKELVLEFDELIQAGKLSKSRFKVKAGKKRLRVISAEVPEDDAVAILNLKSTLPASTSALSLTCKDLKGDQNSKVIQDLDGNDLQSFRNFQVEIL